MIRDIKQLLGTHISVQFCLLGCIGVGCEDVADTNREVAMSQAFGDLHGIPLQQGYPASSLTTPTKLLRSRAIYELRRHGCQRSLACFPKKHVEIKLGCHNSNPKPLSTFLLCRYWTWLVTFTARIFQTVCFQRNVVMDPSPCLLVNDGEVFWVHQGDTSFSHLAVQHPEWGGCCLGLTRAEHPVRSRIGSRRGAHPNSRGCMPRTPRPAQSF